MRGWLKYANGPQRLISSRIARCFIRRVHDLLGAVDSGEIFLRPM